MVGTLFGFLMVLGQSFSEIDTSSTESMTAAISLLATGMSTALVTSLVGLIASLWLKLQLVVLDS
jgi:biopolymer transport protein ExbB/TolQ